MRSHKRIPQSSSDRCICQARESQQIAQRPSRAALRKPAGGRQNRESPKRVCPFWFCLENPKGFPQNSTHPSSLIPPSTRRLPLAQLVPACSSLGGILSRPAFPTRPLSVSLAQADRPNALPQTGHLLWRWFEETQKETTARRSSLLGGSPF